MQLGYVYLMVLRVVFCTSSIFLRRFIGTQTYATEVCVSDGTTCDILHVNHLPEEVYRNADLCN